MTQPKNKELYEKIKKEIIMKNPKHSAYRSGLIVKAYKEAGGTYEGTKPTKTGLTRWFDEKWTNQRGEVGYKKKGDIYRPNVRITKDTQIDDLLTKVKIISQMNAILCDRIKNLQYIISSNLPNHLNAILEFL